MLVEFIRRGISDIHLCEWRDNGIVEYPKLKGGRVDIYQISGKLIYKESGRTMMWCPVGMLIREHIALQSGLQPPLT